ncbi:MAG TPA: alcohol dehydrogenase catalytic domain-containing protein [Candidatus Binatia bacterium]|jgi:D-arabinose 1-dehydrogenase-like Zn-dependent alcohol dehydrogenase
MFILPLGADGAEVVVEVGSKVKHVEVGDAVCLYPPTGCGQCEFCLTDRGFMCFRLRVLELKTHGSTLGSRIEFRLLISFMNATGIKPVIGTVFPLSEAAEVQRYVEKARQFGKVILNIPD